MVMMLTVLRLLGCVITFVTCLSVVFIAALIEWVGVTAKLIYVACKEAVWCNARDIVVDYQAAQREGGCDV